MMIMLDIIFRCRSPIKPNQISFAKRRTARRRFQRYTLIIVVSLLITISVQASILHSISSCRHNFQELRGGDVNDENVIIDDAKENVLANDYPQENIEIKKRSTWLPGLFEHFDSIKSEVSTTTETTLLGTGSNSFESGRGGALVKEKPTRISHLFGRRDPTRLSSLLPLPSDSNSLVAAKSIWVNAWADNLPDNNENTVVRILDTEPSRREQVVDAITDYHTDQLHKAIKTDPSTHKLTDENELVRDNLDFYKSEEGSLSNEDAFLSESILNATEKSVNRTDLQITQTESFGNASQKLGSIIVESREFESKYVSSGYWGAIDTALTLGYCLGHDSWRISTNLRKVRKVAASVTGLHGLISGKPRSLNVSNYNDQNDKQARIIRMRLDAINRAKQNLERLSAVGNSKKRKRFLFWGKDTAELELLDPVISSNPREKTAKEIFEERIRMERVKEIDRQVEEGQIRLFELACEKDVLQRRPNPLWNYTVQEQSIARNDTNTSESLVLASREFNFPPQEIVDDYLEMLFSTGRIVKMNHTDLWQKNVEEDDEDEDLALPTFYRTEIERKKSITNGDAQSGSWFLRNGLGEKIGETAESSAYKAVCQSVMSILAKSLSALHGVNVMTFSDIRLFVEQTPSLPPLAPDFIPGTNQRGYAQATINDMVRRGAKKRSKRRLPKRRSMDEAFIQRDAVVETLLSQCQIAAPLLKLFPLPWQRAMIANIITLITAIVADFCEGLEFQILGHRLSFTFTPITEDDMLRGLVHDSVKNERNSNPEHFESAVAATANDIGKNLKFLDRWHERALGGGVLRTQIATLIARLVLTLVDDILHGAKISLWAAHAGGPRLTAGLEYRTTNDEDNATFEY